jgi:hypothetical protein
MNMPDVAPVRTRPRFSVVHPTLSAAEFAQAMNISVPALQQREAGRQIFSVRLPQQNERGYPALQLEQGIVGAPLLAILHAMHKEARYSALLFFYSPNALLADLSPVEALTGKITWKRILNNGESFMRLSHEERLDAVIQAAQLHVPC